MNLFEINDVEYKIDQQKILKKQNFAVKKIEHLLILGPSGSGKTTLLNLLSGLLKPSSGEIIFSNKKYSTLSEEQIDKLRLENFGFIFQKPYLIKHLNIEQNISLFPKQSSKSDNLNLLNILGLSDKAKQKAYGLSVGEAQRVAIARGLANNPKIIFADEPTSALDDENTENVLKLLFSYCKKNDSTIIVSSHDKRIKSFFSRKIEIKL